MLLVSWVIQMGELCPCFLSLVRRVSIYVFLLCLILAYKTGRPAAVRANRVALTVLGKTRRSESM